MCLFHSQLSLASLIKIADNQARKITDYRLSRSGKRVKDKFRKRYLLVAVRSPDHHGLFVGDLAGGDGVDLLDVLDLGNGLHGVNNWYECDIWGLRVRFQRAFSSFLPFSKDFLFFYFFVLFHLKSIKSTTWPALRPPLFCPGVTKKTKVEKKQKWAFLPALCARDENRRCRPRKVNFVSPAWK